MVKVFFSKAMTVSILTGQKLRSENIQHDKHVHRHTCTYTHTQTHTHTYNPKHVRLKLSQKTKKKS